MFFLNPAVYKDSLQLWGQFWKRLLRGSSLGAAINVLILKTA